MQKSHLDSEQSGNKRENQKNQEHGYELTLL